LCHANIRKIAPGDIVFFYRSRKYGGITTCGVIEDIIVSRDPQTIAQYVGKRTVYTYPEIEYLSSKGNVLVILFRLSRSIIEPIALEKILEENIIKKAPQSIISLSSESAKWLKKQLAM